MNRPLLLILVTFVVLGVVYSLTTPIFEAPDEIEHYFYIKHIADEWRLPVQDPENVGPWGQEGGQPPLFYALGALITFWIDSSDASELVRYNPHANVGLALAHGNKNVIIHTDREAFPYRGTVLALHLARLLSIPLGAAAVLATYLIALEIFPARRDIALGSAAINAFIPQFLFSSGIVSNDVTVAALAGWALLLMARLITRGLSGRRLVALGVILGLAALAKLSGLGLIALTVAVLTGLALQRRDASVLLKGGLIVLGLATLMTGWWYVRNALLYGDPLGLKIFLGIVSRRDTFSWRALWNEFEGIGISFWALFGWFNVPIEPFVYRLYDGLSLAGLLGLIWLVVKNRWKQFDRKPVPPDCKSGKSEGEGASEEERPHLLAILALWLLITFLSLVQWTWLTTGSQGRLLFPAVSALSVLLAAGLAQLAPRRCAPWLLGLVGGAMAVMALLAPFLYIAPTYARPPILSPEEVPVQIHRLDVSYGGEMKLLGYELGGQRVRRGEYLTLTLYWQSLAPMERDYSVYIHLFGREGQPVGEEDTYPGLGAYSTTLWHPGDIVRDTYKVLVEPTAKAPGLCQIDVGLYDLATIEPLPAYDREGQPVARPAIAPVKITTWVPPRYEIGQPVYFDLGGEVALIGYKLKPGKKSLQVNLYWQGRQIMSEDYTVFVHLLDDEGGILAQHDGQPVGGDYPTPYWDAGEVVKDVHVLESVLPGKYQLVVGMYRLADGRRLPLLDERGGIVDDKIALSPVEIH